MGWLFTKALIAAVVVVAVTEVAQRQPRLGALLLTLPIVSILAFVLLWIQQRDLPIVTRLARETLILVPLGLPFFVPLALADRCGLGFWGALLVGIALALCTIGLWLYLGPQRL
jgi:hypothetical protein